MTKEFFYLLQLLNSVINKRPPPPPPDAMDWSALYREVVEQSLGAILFPAANALPPETGMPEDVMNQWKTGAFHQGMVQIGRDAALKKLLRRFETEGLRVILFKGPILAELYPPGAKRISVDVDLLAQPEQMPRFARVLEEEGYVFNEAGSTINENTFQNPALNVEMHTRLWEEAAGKRHDRLCALEIGTLERAVQVDVFGEKAWTLPPQEKLVYLIYHMIKHFFVCGVGVSYLSDITLYVRRYAQDVDWDRFWAAIDSLGYTAFTKSFFFLCIKYMELPAGLVRFPDMGQEEEARAERLLMDFYEGGHNGRKTVVRYKAGRVLRVYYENEEKTVPRSRLVLLRQMFFPKKSEIENRRTNLGKVSGFLPIAWLQHLAFLFQRWKSGREGRCSLKDRIDCAQARLDLLHDLELIE